MLLILITVLALLAGVLVCCGCGAFATLAWLWIFPLSALSVFLGIVLLGFLGLLYMCKRVDQTKPQEEDDKFYRIVANLVIEAAFPVVRIHVKKSGIEKVPTDGRFLLVCNHCNNADPIILLYCLKKFQLAFISKRENSGLFVAGKLMHRILCQPINRENDREALKTILKCIELLKKDMVSVAVFPEGYTSMDEKLHPFRHGVFKIAQKAQVPIVVCTVQNTQKVFRNAARLKATDVHLHLLAVIPPEEYKGITAVELGERVYQLMAEDLGPENVLPR